MLVTWIQPFLIILPATELVQAGRIPSQETMSAALTRQPELQGERNGSMLIRQATLLKILQGLPMSARSQSQLLTVTLGPPSSGPTYFSGSISGTVSPHSTLAFHLAQWGL